MRFHVPKPLNGWRAFAGEVGIIVLGVLIALGAQQVVEDLHEKTQLHELEIRMIAELRDDDLPQAFARAAIRNCNADQLDTIERAVASGDRANVIELAKRYEPPFRSWDDAAWKAALASQALTNGGMDRMIGWSTAYGVMPILTQWTADEQANLPRLRVKMSGAGPLSAAQQDRLFQVIADLRSKNLQMSGGSIALLNFAANIGLRVKPKDRAKILADARRTFGGCVTDPSQIPRASKSPYAVPREALEAS